MVKLTFSVLCETVVSYLITDDVVITVVCLEWGPSHKCPMWIILSHWLSRVGKVPLISTYINIYIYMLS